MPVLRDLLEHGTHLDIWCCRHGCFRHVRWPAEQAVAKLGAGCTFPAAARRLRCSACGARGREREVQCRPCSADQAEQRWQERLAREGRRGC